MKAWDPPREDDLVDFALRIIGTESLSAHEGPCAEIIASAMDSLGFEVETDELGNVLGMLVGGPGPCVLLDAHIDTVGTTDAAGWSHAHQGERVGSRLYGRGAVDMKGPLAAAIFGVAGLKAGLRRGKVVLSATVAEELVEGVALTHVLQRVEPNRVIICEATGLGLACGQRGRIELVVEVQGRATHSSRPDLGINAAGNYLQRLVLRTDTRHPATVVDRLAGGHGSRLRGRAERQHPAVHGLSSVPQFARAGQQPDHAEHVC